MVTERRLVPPSGVAGEPLGFPQASVAACAWGHTRPLAPLPCWSTQDRPAPSAVKDLDCQGLFGSFPNPTALLRTCETWRATALGEVSLEAWRSIPAIERGSTLAYLAKRGTASRSLNFFQVNIDALPTRKQDEVHGLLGQRAIAPKPLVKPAQQQQAAGEPPATTNTMTSRSESLAGSAPGGGMGTILAVVGADGGLEGAHQGEGAIDGSFKEYQVPWASTHDTFMHSRFACDAP